MKEDLAMAKPNLEDEIERKDLKKVSNFVLFFHVADLNCFIHSKLLLQDLETSVSKHDLEVVFGEYGPLEHIKTFHGD
jgi:hypothetical protein